MKNILITGITGFVGSHIADLCIQKNIKPFGMKRYHLSNMRNVTHIENDINWLEKYTKIEDLKNAYIRERSIIYKYKGYTIYK